MPISPTTYKLLAFDIYGTLIDWETGISNLLLPLYAPPPSRPSHPSHTTPLQTRKNILTQYTLLEQSIQSTHPTLPYPQVLISIYDSLCTSLQIPCSSTFSQKFGSSTGSWPAFPDTISAMQSLSKHYKLVVLSNVDKSSFSRTLSGPLSGVKFDAVYTAQDIGSYKPDLKNFEYLIGKAKEEFGVEKEEILMVAQSLYHDHVAIKRLGMRSSVWISRGGEVEGEGPVMGGNIGELEGSVDLGARFGTLGEFAQCVEEAFGGVGSGDRREV